jgi:hypothetical protein
MFHGDCERFCLSFEKQSNDTAKMKKREREREREKQSKNDRKTHIPDII